MWHFNSIRVIYRNKTFLDSEYKINIQYLSGEILFIWIGPNGMCFWGCLYRLEFCWNVWKPSVLTAAFCLCPLPPPQYLYQPVVSALSQICSSYCSPVDSSLLFFAKPWSSLFLLNTSMHRAACLWYILYTIYNRKLFIYFEYLML